MAGNSSIQEKLRQGIEAARKGDKLVAQRLLRQVVDGDRNNEIAWMWLASTLDNLQERRSALEEALRINPANTRAQEALRQLDAVLPPTTRRPAAGGRPTGGALPRVGAGNVNNTALIIGGVVIGIILLVVIIFSVVSNNQQAALPNAATREALQAAILYTATPLPTIDPKSYTATPFYGVIVTRDVKSNVLPPTFTPTFTPQPSSTPLPTETPFPISKFTILYTSLNSGDAQPSLYSMSGDGSADQMIGAGSDGYSDIAYAPDREQIAFVRTVTYDKDGQSVTAPELFIAPAANPNAAKQLTHQGGTHLASPAWASDSVQLLFVSNSDGDDEIWYITVDGNNLRQITQSDGVDKDPVWSPNNDVIVFASERANYNPNGTNLGLTEIFSVTNDGETVTQLTDDQGSSYSPSFSADGTRITFASDRGGKGNIYVMNADGENPVRLTLNPLVENRQPAFTPNGQSIVFLSNQGGDNFQFYIMDANGNGITRLVDPGRNIQSFAFLPLPLAIFNP